MRFEIKQFDASINFFKRTKKKLKGLVYHNFFAGQQEMHSYLDRGINYGIIHKIRIIMAALIFT
jgi:hypothetical protein